MKSNKKSRVLYCIRMMPRGKDWSSNQRLFSTRRVYRQVINLRKRAIFLDSMGSNRIRMIWRWRGLTFREKYLFKHYQGKQRQSILRG